MQDGNLGNFRKTGNLGNILGIPIQEIPGREKFEVAWEGGNRTFPLNIPVMATPNPPSLLPLHTFLEYVGEPGNKTA